MARRAGKQSGGRETGIEEQHPAEFGKDAHLPVDQLPGNPALGTPSCADGRNGQKTAACNDRLKSVQHLPV
jgi:hypothetical protein